jgi:hypothetical protein
MYTDLLDLEFVTQHCLNALKNEIEAFGLLNNKATEVAINNIQTADSRYSFKAHGRVMIGKDVSGLTIIGFCPGDGTGSQQDYQIAGVQENNTPRNKPGFAELFIPLGTAYNGSFIGNVTCLDALTLEGGKLLKYATLTMPENDYAEIMICNHEHEMLPLPMKVPAMALSFQGNYGNPHAIVFPKERIDDVNSFPAHWVQFGAFMNLKVDALGRAIVEYVKDVPPQRIIT